MKRQTSKEAEAILLQAREVRALTDQPGWKALVRIFENGIENRKEKLVSHQCGAEETLRLRVEIDTMRRFLLHSQISDEDLMAFQKTMEGLLLNEQRRESFGWDRPMPASQPNGEMP